MAKTHRLADLNHGQTSKTIGSLPLNIHPAHSLLRRGLGRLLPPLFS